MTPVVTMGTRMRSVLAVLAVSSLATHSLGFNLDSLGFNLPDMDKAVRERDTGIRQSPEQTPANGLADYLLQAFDTNSDGEVALTELRQMISQYFEVRKQQGRESEETEARFRFQYSGPIITIATLIDADDSGSLDRNELERMTNTMVNETGSPMVVTEITLRIDSLRRALANHSITSNIDGVVTKITNALDADNDGAISNEELMTLKDTYWFRSRYDMMAGLATQADQDGNNSLNGAEIRGWLELLNDEYARYVRRLTRFGSVAERFGRDLAMQMITE